MVEETDIGGRTNFTLEHDDMEHLKGGNSLVLDDDTEVSLTSLFWQDAPTVFVVEGEGGNLWLVAADREEEAERVVLDKYRDAEVSVEVQGSLAQLLDQLDGDGSTLRLA